MKKVARYKEISEATLSILRELNGVGMNRMIRLLAKREVVVDFTVFGDVLQKMTDAEIVEFRNNKITLARTDISDIVERMIRDVMRTECDNFAISSAVYDKMEAEDMHRFHSPFYYSEMRKLLDKGFIHIIDGRFYFVGMEGDFLDTLAVKRMIMSALGERTHRSNDFRRYIMKFFDMTFTQWIRIICELESSDKIFEFRGAPPRYYHAGTINLDDRVVAHYVKVTRLAFSTNDIARIMKNFLTGNRGVFSLSDVRAAISKVCPGVPMTMYDLVIALEPYMLQDIVIHRDMSMVVCNTSDFLR